MNIQPGLNFKNRLVKKENIKLRKRVHPCFMKEVETKNVIKYIKEYHSLNDDERTALAKFRIVTRLTKLEKFFKHTQTVSLVYWEKNNELFGLNLPTRDGRHAPVANRNCPAFPEEFQSILSLGKNQIKYMGPLLVSENEPLANTNKILKNIGIQSTWYAPVWNETKTIGFLAFLFKKEIDREPDDSECELISETLELISDDLSILHSTYNKVFLEKKYKSSP